MRIKSIHKKGISPLIATVLLIGFTVALVALVIVWGRNFTEEKAEKEGALAQAQLSCESLDYTVTRAEFDQGALTLTLEVKNKGSTGLDAFIFRVLDAGEVYVLESGEKVEGFTTRSLEIIDPKLADLGGVDSVEIIPRLQAARAKYVPCSSKAKTVKSVTIL